ncbi:membrane protein [Synergistales bacterium]|nr:membrane protein [Synergistales bacterium]
MNPGLHTPVLILLLASGFLALWFRNLLHSVISLGVFSLVLALEFYILRAPDVAIAEASIGAGLSTTIFIITLRACKGRPKGGDPK